METKVEHCFKGPTNSIQSDLLVPKNQALQSCYEQSCEKLPSLAAPTSPIQSSEYHKLWLALALSVSALLLSPLPMGIELNLPNHS
uniref:Uncharacterized protein n=1 Tax=Cucumis melo TaxID=3656 RepID=A0A9I9E7X9_CUCME